MCTAREITIKLVPCRPETAATGRTLGHVSSECTTRLACDLIEVGHGRPRSRRSLGEGRGHVQASNATPSPARAICAEATPQRALNEFALRGTWLTRICAGTWGRLH